MHTHAGNALDNHVTLTFDLLTSLSTHAERLPCSVCLLNLILIAQAIISLDGGHTDPQTHPHTKSQTLVTTLPTHRLQLALL